MTEDDHLSRCKIQAQIRTRKTYENVHSRKENSGVSSQIPRGFQCREDHQQRLRSTSRSLPCGPPGSLVSGTVSLFQSRAQRGEVTEFRVAQRAGPQACSTELDTSPPEAARGVLGALNSPMWNGAEQAPSSERAGRRNCLWFGMVVKFREEELGTQHS